MHLVWFRSDLRTLDNRALTTACDAAKERGQAVIGAYIATPQQWKQQDVAPIQADFIYRRLTLLQQQLNNLGIGLLYAEVPTYKEVDNQLAHWVECHRVHSLYFNKQYSINEKKRDDTVVETLKHLTIHQFDDALLVPPGKVLSAEGTPYKVFTPYRKRWLNVLTTIDNRPSPRPSVVNNTTRLNTKSIPVFSYPCVDSSHFTVDDTCILEQLRRFCQQQVDAYRAQRDMPSLESTSRLSPYLALGCISPRQCLARLLHHFPTASDQRDSGAFAWLNELIWREFYTHLLVSYPDLAKGHAFHQWTEQIPWSTDQSHFDAWKTGQTGYPIVDAAMRQLNKTGWMHNRLRMITASFLTKNLLIDWRWGERYFMSHLIDGDIAANNGGWQWCASTGTDAQPYFRIFNATTQSRRFDPTGEFIRQWLPQLSQVPDKSIHEPLHWADKNGIQLDYPERIVDHNETRKRAINVFAQTKDQYIAAMDNNATLSNNNSHATPMYNGDNTDKNLRIGKEAR